MKQINPMITSIMANYHSKENSLFYEMKTRHYLRLFNI